MDGVYGCVGVMIYYLLRCEYEYVHVVMYKDVSIASRKYIRGLRQKFCANHATIAAFSQTNTSLWSG